jgi:hypothetical protein
VATFAETGVKKAEGAIKKVIVIEPPAAGAATGVPDPTATPVDAAPTHLEPAPPAATPPSPPPEHDPSPAPKPKKTIGRRK